MKIGKLNGTITDGASGKVSAFVKRLGVYFIKLRVPRKITQPETADQGKSVLDFTRQGAP